MFKAILKYSVILGMSLFLMQIVKAELGLTPYEFYLPVFLLAIVMIALGYFAGSGQFDQNIQTFRQQRFYNVLTDREKEVAGMILEGMSNKEIQSTLHVEKSTLKTHINNIYRKGNISNRREFKELLQ